MTFRSAGLILGIAASAAVCTALIRTHAVGGTPGNRTTICGSIVSARSAIELRDDPVFLTLGHAYAGRDLTVVAVGRNRARFAVPAALIGHRICVFGRMLRFLGQPRLLLDASVQ